MVLDLAFQSSDHPSWKLLFLKVLSWDNEVQAGAGLGLQAWNRRLWLSGGREGSPLTFWEPHPDLIISPKELQLPRPFIKPWI